MYLLKFSCSSGLYDLCDVEDVVLLSGKPSKSSLCSILLNELKRFFVGKTDFDFSLKSLNGIYLDSFRSSVSTSCRIDGRFYKLSFSLCDVKAIDT